MIRSGVLIQIKNKQSIRKASKVLAFNFMQDPLYCYIFEGKCNKKPAMEAFFYAYLKFLMPYSDILADSDEMHLVAAVWFSNRVNSTFVYGLRTLHFGVRLLGITSLVGFSGALKLIKTIRVMSSTWIDKHVDGPYCHLDLAVIDKAYRGRGVFTEYLQYVKDNYSGEGRYLTLETQSQENVLKYTHLGFCVVEEIQLPNSPLVQYCMICEVDGK
jgi:GNAT superfamily N-acetyltransferase